MKEKILMALRSSKGYVSGQELCEILGVSRTAIWKNIGLLRGEGYDIQAVKHLGYELVGTPDSIDSMEMKGYIRTKWLGKFFLSQKTVDSTNSWAKRLAEEGASHGTVVTADEQTDGRGRRGRRWITPAGSTIAVTKILRPDMPPERASMLTLIEGLSVAQAIRHIYGLAPGIKWPNDVVISGKKICGILTEMSAQVDYVNYIVIGTGVNANLREFPEELRDSATSLELELGHPVKRAQLLGGMLDAFEKNYNVFQKTWDLSGLLEDYNGLLINRGRQVRVLEPGNEYEGIARGIDTTGRLLVERADGSVTEVYAGEVSVRGLYGYV